jgi:subtilisin family serine protease
VPGAAIDAAHALLAGRRPARQVVVAIIDGGVDITHEDMDGVLWTNPRETPGNRTDDDRNGFVDDVHGWNFIGGATESVNHDTFELTRLQAACTGGQAAAGLPSPGPERCAQIATDYQAEVAEVNGQVEQIQQIRQIYPLIVQALRQALGSEPTPAKVAALRPASAQIAQAQNLYMQLAELGLDEAKLAEQGEAVQNLLRYGLDINFNPRTIVGDNWTNTADKAYGNADVAGPDAGHGTAVASVVAAERGNGLGIDGVADGVRIMSVRTVPNGDERDKDVANAIRYAVDNGANIINMSFGKAYSPQKPAVDEAVRYADQRGVLMIHASGNDGEDLATNESYPRKTYAQSGAANLWIEVGASSWRAPDELAASFSNYGAQQVDLFAPGVSIRSAAPGNKYEPNDGTSLAAPVVTGVAALLMAYFPNLDAAAVKRILLDTATNRRDTMVTRPGGMAGPIRFGDLSVTGGVVNAEAAVRAALQQNR